MLVQLVKKVLLLLIVLISWSAPDSFSQEKKPKVALVLSGGGAKGVAHIPLLQLLDSLNIVPDIVVGTSMGSIVGGLYSIGYSGDSIASLVHKLNWQNLFSSLTGYDKVSPEEKSEFNKYLVELRIKKGKLKSTTYILNDQNLRNTLKILTLPAYQINNFDSLQIPFRAITVDILTSQQKVLSGGDLSTALRASMSIPIVFEPVLVDNSLLVDGGVVNNFPTDVAKSLGADIIIGSDVAKPTTDIEELGSLNAVLTQTMMLANNKQQPMNIELCDIYVQHYPYLTYSTADFDKCEILYEEGKTATRNKLKSFVELSEKLKVYSQRKIALPNFDNKIFFDTIIYKNISKSNLNLLKDRIGIDNGKVYTITDMENSINRARGTELLQKIDYTPIKIDNKEGLLITGYEYNSHRISGAIYFDSYREIGIIGNYTGRNIFGKTSKVVVTADLAKQPKLSLMGQKNFGSNEQYWVRSETVARSLKQKPSTQSTFGKEYTDNSIETINQINKNFKSLGGYVGLGLCYKYTNIIPLSSGNNSTLILEDYKLKSTSINIHLKSSSLNKLFYPTKGNTLEVAITQSLNQHVEIKYFDNPYTTKRALNQFLKFQLNYQARIPINNMLTSIVETSIGLTHSYNQGHINYFENSYSDFFFIGGAVPITGENKISNYGLFEDELFASQATHLNIGLQYSPYADFYITPTLSYSAVGFNSIDQFMSNFWQPKSNWTERTNTSYLIAAALTVSYNSFIGPITLTISNTSGVNNPGMFFSLGIPFNR